MTTAHPTFEEALTGRTLAAVEKPSSSELVFVDQDGTRYLLYHKSRGCCESVNIEEILGDLADLVGSPVLSAYEATSAERPADAPPPEYAPESQTWTFYRIMTVKGTVVIRWCGESNGYHSESVDFKVVPAAS